MRAEAYLNLARAHERLGALDRALDYARHRFELLPFIVQSACNRVNLLRGIQMCKLCVYKVYYISREM